MLEGRFAVVTGASLGLGAELARHFVAEGASVMLCARGAAPLEAIRTELAAGAAPGQQVLARAADIGRPSDVAALFDAAFAAFPRVDVLVNNAGIHGPLGRLEEIDAEAWMAAVNVNLFGPLHCCRAALPAMRRAGYGKIINLSGGGATAPMPFMSAYAASKAALVRLSETLAVELAGTGIDVNAVAPGAMATRLLDEVLEAGATRVGEDYHRRVQQIREKGGTPPAVAAALCVFLASAESDGITGKLISAPWDRWRDWPRHLDELRGSDVYTLRRIAGRDRGMTWGDA
ncbi:SDR family NAD(P)-dependent oxidoreductase [Falsiroseomonas sp. HW251]|uniref:SDR family NAD(P)-dependent oxidoreductase n=1 Tax=Falsiroseomonas sp. HW251 TaxID=3390998 RepID=UPI003D30FDB5